MCRRHPDVSDCKTIRNRDSTAKLGVTCAMPDRTYDWIIEYRISYARASRKRSSLQSQPIPTTQSTAPALTTSQGR